MSDIPTLPPFLGPPVITNSQPPVTDAPTAAPTDTGTEFPRPPPLTPPTVSASDPVFTSPPPPSFSLPFTPITPTDSTSSTSIDSPTLPTSTPTSDTDTVSTPPSSYLPANTSSTSTRSSSSPAMSAASTSTSSSLSPSSSTTVLPVSATATHNHHAGAIAGGVIGGIAFLVALICAILFVRSRYATSRIRKRRRHSAAAATFRKWDGLGSLDGLPTTASTHAAYNTAAPTRHSSTGSTAVMLGGRKDSISHSAYDDPEDEKSPVTATPSSHGHEPMEVFSPPSAYAYDFPATSIPATPTSAAFPPGRPRDHSMSQNRSRALSDLESGSPRSPPMSPTSALYNYNYNRQSLDGRVLSSPPTSPTSQHSESIRMNRTSIGRHAARKPVPKYDENEFMDTPTHATAPLPMVPTPPSVHTQLQTQTPELTRGSVYFDSRATPSASSSSSNLQGGSSNAHASVQTRTSITVARSREDLIAAGYHIPKLTEKTSFGDMRNVHYLIPDPPPQARD